MTSERLHANLSDVRARIADAARRAGRPPDGVTLVAVTKRRPADDARALVAAGITDLGENYPQELWAKAAVPIDTLVRWHLIGHLQGNKARRTLPLVAMIHAVDSLRLLRSLDELAGAGVGSARACLQVNCSGEPSKHGWSPDAILDDAAGVADCRRIAVVGLMTMAALDASPDEARRTFARLREMRDRLRDRTGLPLPELSMGMSNDFEAAVAEGATLVRVGSALFEGLGP